VKNKKSKIGFAAALGGLVAVPSCKVILPSAMCYDPAVVVYEDYRCPYCGETSKNLYDSYTVIYFINQIEEMVSQIKKLGFDAILDKTEFCPICRDNNIVNPELIFKIRFSDKVDYHIARSNIVNEYQCLLDFLSNPDNYSGNRAIIQKMTGLGADLKIE